jgi:hypothetical protein
VRIRRQTGAGRRWLTPVILATQKAEIRRIAVQSQPGHIVLKILSQKSLHTHTKKIGLVEWLKVKALSLSPRMPLPPKKKTDGGVL